MGYCMLLMFPSGLPVQDDFHTIRSLNKEDFDREVSELVSSGWEVIELTSRYRKALFGGVVSYKGVLRRGYKKQASST